MTVAGRGARVCSERCAGSRPADIDYDDHCEIYEEMK